ncbi:hypothetical protein KNP414_03642 [Paenibacillus mucilaginosus KNP414]|uniref:Uncharacterized protein n=1 Tax=Paenibacillus mucilaginosus (strain KNP414) TaxID=1036673 RepID=F8FFF8_PAEMK|nr:hypothetical protein KNP414_03642 [Paenibacillus mucilaginosus KNP414]
MDEDIPDRRQGDPPACGRDGRTLCGEGGAWGRTGCRAPLEARRLIRLRSAATGSQEEQGGQHAAGSNRAPPVGLCHGWPASLPSFKKPITTMYRLQGKYNGEGRVGIIGRVRK